MSIDLHTCTKCKENLPVAAYAIVSQYGRPYRVKRCRKCSSAASKAWAIKNSDRIKFLQQSWRKRNPDKVRSHWMKSAAKRKLDPILSEKRKETERIQSRKKYAEPRSKIRILLRSRMNKLLSRNLRGCLTHSKLDWVGCSIDELKNYIESQFKPGMTWENWSIHGWHIDHIKPLASFDLSNESERKQAFHFSNLQPLWAIENLKKSDSFQVAS